jgi:hypothetical protein
LFECLWHYFHFFFNVSLSSRIRFLPSKLPKSSASPSACSAAHESTESFLCRPECVSFCCYRHLMSRDGGGRKLFESQLRLPLRRFVMYHSLSSFQTLQYYHTSKTPSVAGPLLSRTENTELIPYRSFLQLQTSRFRDGGVGVCWSANASTLTSSPMFRW